MELVQLVYTIFHVITQIPFLRGSTHFLILKNV